MNLNEDLHATSYPVSHLVQTMGVKNWADTPAKKKFTNDCIARHFSNDWGDLCPEDKRSNNRSLKDGNQLLSTYTYKNKKLWVISDAADYDGKRVVTLLFPEEY